MRQKISCILMSLLLTLTFILQPAMQSSAMANTAAAPKVSPRLLEQFEKKEQVSFLVKLRKQADTPKVAREAAQKAKAERFSPMRVELAQRSSVLSTLRTTAFETQSSLRSFLATAKKSGQVQKFKSFYIINAFAVTATKEVAEEIARRPEVERVLPDETRHIISPQKTKASKIKSSNNIEWNISKVGAPKAWEMGLDGAGRVVANIDTGVEWTHPALKRQYRGYNASNPDAPNHTYNWFDAIDGKPEPYDEDNHGTHTMGTMVGSEEDGSNVVGVAPGAKWIAVRALTSSGGSDSTLISAGEWLLAPKDADGTPHPEKAPDVINNSWGGGPGIDDWYRTVVKNWRAAGIFAEFSAGNARWGDPTPGSVANPANYPESFATGATDINNKLADFSLLGPSPYEETLKPELSAPGVNIRSAVPGGKYESGWNGTSMSGPHTSAAIAILKQINSSLSVDELETILKQSATPLTDDKYPKSPNNGYGHGLLNIEDAVKALVKGGFGKITGQVLQPGEDNEKPTFSHEQPAEVYATAPIPLKVEAQDNVAVKSVEVSFKSEGQEKWTQAVLPRSSGSAKSGTYKYNVPGNLVTSGKFLYKFTITDFVGNVTESETYEVKVTAPLTLGYSTNFQERPQGWLTTGSPTWQWGAPESGPKKAFTGDNVYATNLKGEYENNSNMTLILPPIRHDSKAAYLNFKHWYDIEDSYDEGSVVLSTDMKEWKTLTKFTGSKKTWMTSSVDLSQYSGQTVYVGFRLVSDPIVPAEGWYLDSVSLSDTSNSKKRKKDEIAPEETKPAQETGKRVKHKKPALTLENLSYAAVPTKKDKVKKPGVTSSQQLPLEATVTVLETGKSVRTNPDDGSFRLVHPVGEYTLKAEAYGYTSKTEKVTVGKGEEASATFVLEPLAKGTVSGVLSNKETGKPVANAMIMLKEDGVIKPVYTDKDGRYSITAYEGKYTMQAVAFEYYTQETLVSLSKDRSLEHNIALDPFLGYPQEISFDNGTPTGKAEAVSPGNGWAVKMSLAKGKKAAMVTGGTFRFWKDDKKATEGSDFKVALYDSSGPDGAPGNLLAGPVEAKSVRDGSSWTEVDLKNKAVVVTGDFYVVYLQSRTKDAAPTLAIDEDGDLYSRSWRMANGAFSKLTRNKGNYMIRAHVNYQIDTPVITTPSAGTFTNKETVQVEGVSAPNSTVELFNNSKSQTTVTANADGSFKAELKLKAGTNKLTAQVTTAIGKTKASAPVQVERDTEAPKLKVDDLKDKMKTNQQVLTVSGKATDKCLDKVTVNGTATELKSDGSYSLQLILKDGENLVTVTATDKAGNTTTKSFTVYTKLKGPNVLNLKPAKNLFLSTGESITVELDSEAGLEGEIDIKLPRSGDLLKTSSKSRVKLLEKKAGHYAASWTVSDNLCDIKGAVIQVTLRDEFGNVTVKDAKGKLFINLAE